MPPNGHALLSASASDRWLHCPPSARLCELYEDKGSDYAAEGTDAHTLCEYKLRKALGMEATDPTENLTWFNQEMDECANDYVAYMLVACLMGRNSCQLWQNICAMTTFLKTINGIVHIIVSVVSYRSRA